MEIIYHLDKILTLIPQKPPVVMLDKLFFSDRKRTITGLKIKKENIFCSNNFFREPGIIETIAQTAALRVGYICEQENTPIPLGFIGAVKNLLIYDLPKVDDDIITEINVEQEVFDITLVTGSVKVGDRLIAECEMKIFLKKD